MKNIISILILTIFLVGILYFVPDQYENSIWIGFIALFFSFLTIIQVKGETELCVLFSIILYINLSAYVLGPVTKGLLFGAYQFALWNSQYDTIGMKCILISSIVFYMFFRQKRSNNTLKRSVLTLSYPQNSLISIACLFFVLIICFYFFNGSASGGNYQSNSNALYEYVIFIMVLAWYYGGRKTIIKTLWIICAAYYVLLGIMAGDRSSSFMLLTLIVLYKFQDVSFSKIIIFCLLGIFAANTIAMFREGLLSRGMEIQLLYVKGLKTIFSDTAAQSYYSGITIFYYLDKIGDDVSIFIQWVISLFTGSLFVDRSAVELSKVASGFNSNAGGGLFQSMFYSFYGYVGVALGSSIVAYIISKVYYSWTNTFSIMLRYVIPVMSFRWYLYTPTTFFRACLLNFGIIYLAAKILNSISHPQKRI